MIACHSHRVDRDSVCLILVRVGIRIFVAFLVVAFGIHEATKFVVHIGAIADGGYAHQPTHQIGDFDRGLMRYDVTDLVSQHASNFVFAVCACDQLSGEVNAPTCQAEAVNFRRIDQDKSKANLGWWKNCEQPCANLLQVCILGGVFDYGVLVLNQIGHRVAEPHLLLVGE